MKKLRSHAFFIKGFTLPELIVSCGIIALIAVVVVFNHQKFNSNLELTNVAYRVALAIRQAQVYGVSVREFDGGSGGRFDVPYGISFYNTGGGDSQKSFVFFADSNPSLGNYPNLYDGPPTTGCNGGSSDECIQRITLGRDNIIKKVCARSNNFGGGCIPSTYNAAPFCQSINTFNIVFKRPKSDPIITASRVIDGTNRPTTGPCGPTTDLFICLEAPTGRQKAVHITSAGQISVEDVVSESPTGNGICIF